MQSVNYTKSSTRMLYIYMYYYFTLKYMYTNIHACNIFFGFLFFIVLYMIIVPGMRVRLSAECHSYPVPRALFNSKCVHAEFRCLSLDTYPSTHLKRFYHTATGYVLTMLSRNDGRSNVPLC